jgi:uncharacterized protein (DUF1800 family)
MHRLTRREFLRAGAVAAALPMLTACDPLRTAGQFFGLGLKRELKAPFEWPAASEETARVAHVLNRLTFGAWPGQFGVVRAQGVEAFIEGQLNPGSIDDTLCERAISHFADLLHEPAEEHFNVDDELLIPAFRRLTVLRAVYSERQLFEVMTHFWTDHFNIDPAKGDARWLKPADDREVVRAHALGKFSELVRASATSPAMLWYLDGRANVKRNREDKPNENYARELLELHTMGVDGGYTQRDVMEVARCLTGWTVEARNKDEFTFEVSNPFEARGPLVRFHPELHDHGVKTVLGVEIPGNGGAADLDRVIEIVCAHPSTARYVALKLCQRFIADDPSPAVVAEVADAYSRSGGAISAMLRTLFTTESFWNARGGKFKRPFHYVVSALRALNAETDGGKFVMDYLDRMGHAPFRYPTPDGYPEEASHWLGTLMWRWKFALAAAGNTITNTKIDAEELMAHAGGTKVNWLASLLMREGTREELEAFADSENILALSVASPAFQTF